MSCYICLLHQALDIQSLTDKDRLNWEVFQVERLLSKDFHRCI